ncbi:hypothetical protein RV09_GL000070 [Enterococcus moraviensis]|nr:hypothetical protein RV09_GL000070 [Enterococcus moraviensis]
MIGVNKMVLEALDKIREAEEAVEKKRQAIKKEIDSYEQEKNAVFQKRQQESQVKIAHLLHEIEEQKTEQLQKEKSLLISDAQKQNQDFREKYEKNKEVVIDHVIERVKNIYGSQ